jgi:MFS transporter, UMF1 family
MASTPSSPAQVPPQGRKPGFLFHLGLHRPELRAWAMYDWANSAFVTTVMAAVFPAFFIAVPAGHLEEQVAMGYFGTATTISIIAAAIVSPILGAFADYRGLKKPLLGTFAGVGITACLLMYLIHHGDLYLAIFLFALANFGVMGSFVMYEALLPHIAREHEIDRVATGGYAMGYLGGGILLALNLAWILAPGMFGLPSGEGLTPEQQTLPVRLAFVSVGIWWALFSIPLFRTVREPAPKLEKHERPDESTVRVVFGRLFGTFRELKLYKHAFLMMLAFLIFSDGIGTIQRMAVAYGTAIGIERDSLIVAILITQFVGFPFTFLFGGLAGRFGPKPMIFVGLTVYLGITILGYFMTTAAHFMMLAVLVGMVQGGTQALSRSLFATLIPRHKSGEFFGFFGVMDRFSGAMGSGLMVILAMLGAPLRWSIPAISIFFIGGAAILAFVNVAEGRRIARQAEAETVPVEEVAVV